MPRSNDNLEDDEIEILSTTLHQESRRTGRKKTTRSAKRSSHVIIDLVSDTEPTQNRLDRASSLKLELASLRQTVSRLQRKNRTARENLDDAKATIEKQTRELEILHAMKGKDFTQVAARVKEATKCGICHDTMWDSCSIVECGHSFCHGCLVMTFGEQPKFEENRDEVLKNIRSILRTIRLDPPVGLQQNLMGLVHPSKILRPLSNCPICRKGVFYKPVKNYSLKTVIDIVADLKRAIESEGDRVSSKSEDGAPWVDFLQQSLFAVD